MNINNIIKNKYASAGAVFTLLCTKATNALAAKTWTPDAMINDGLTKGGVNADKKYKVTPDTVTTWVQIISSWILGIAVGFFVLRVVLTAVDRFVFAQIGTTIAVPLAFPNPGDERWDKNDSQITGVQPQAWTWKRIWMNTAKNIAIALGIWIILNVLVGLIAGGFGALTDGGAISNTN